MSYTTFAYDGLEVEELEDELKVTVSVKNTGDRTGSGDRTALYAGCDGKSGAPGEKNCVICKSRLAPNEEKCVELTLKKAEMGFYDNQGQYVKERRRIVPNLCRRNTQRLSV